MNPPGTPSIALASLRAALEPRNLRVEMGLGYPGAVYGQVLSGTMHFSARLLHGGIVGDKLTGNESVYSRPNPGYHRGPGNQQV